MIPIMIVMNGKSTPPQLPPHQKRILNRLIRLLKSGIEGKYIPYPNEELHEVIKHAKRRIPKHKRISRILRYTS